MFLYYQWRRLCGKLTHTYKESTMGHVSKNVTLDNPAFIHESAWLYGKVYIGPGASVGQMW